MELKVITIHEECSKMAEKCGLRILYQDYELHHFALCDKEGYCIEFEFLAELKAYLMGILYQMNRKSK